MERLLDVYFPTTISDIIIKLKTSPLLKIIIDNNQCIFNYNNITSITFHGKSNLYENLVFLDELENAGGEFRLCDYCSDHYISYNPLTKIFDHVVVTRTKSGYFAKQTFTMKILNEQLIEICKELQQFSDHYEERILKRILKRKK